MEQKTERTFEQKYHFIIKRRTYTNKCVCGTPVSKPATTVSHYRYAAATLAVGGVIITIIYVTVHNEGARKSAKLIMSYSVK